jgi:hypothetical protein
LHSIASVASNNIVVVAFRATVDMFAGGALLMQHTLRRFGRSSAASPLPQAQLVDLKKEPGTDRGHVPGSKPSDPKREIAGSNEMIKPRSS